MPKRLARAVNTVVIVALILTAAVPALSAQRGSSATPVVAAPAVIKHTVKQGDTLWDIANFYLKDPFRWTEVFHANTDIVRNPHWIYPGQVLSIDGAAVKPEVAAQANADGYVVAQIQTRTQAPTVFSESEAAAQYQATAGSALPATLTVRSGEYEAAPYVVDSRTPAPGGRVVGAVDVPALGLSSDASFKLFDRIDISAPPGSSLRVGDRVIVARAEAVITDVGRVIEPTGVVRIDSIGSGNHAVATIIRQFGAVKIGQVIVPLGQSFESTTVRPVAAISPVATKLLWIQGSPRLPSVQTYVVLGVNESRGVRLGDQFTLFDDRSFGDGTKAPPASTATITIVRVTPYASTGMVVHQTQPEIRIGMPSRLTAKMP
jgi:LysM repeat protein